MSKVPVHSVNAVSVQLIDGEHVVTLGSGTAKTARYRFDDTHFLLLIVEYAKVKGLELPALDIFEQQEAKPWTPWVVRQEKPFG